MLFPALGHQPKINGQIIFFISDLIYNFIHRCNQQMSLVIAATILKTLSISTLLLDFVLFMSLEIHLFEICEAL